MDAGVVSDCRPQAFASRTAAERVQGPEPAPYLLENSGCRSQRDRRSRMPRRSSPMNEDWRGTFRSPDPQGPSPSSRLLASDPAALATPRHTLFQQPANRIRLEGDEV